MLSYDEAARRSISVSIYIAIFPQHNTLPFLQVFQPRQVSDAVRKLQTATPYNYDGGGRGGGGGGYVLFYMLRIMERTQKPL